MAIGTTNTAGITNEEEKKIFNEKIQDCNWAITQLSRCIGVCGGQSAAQKVMEVYNEKKSL